MSVLLLVVALTGATMPTTIVAAPAGSRPEVRFPADAPGEGAADTERRDNARIPASGERSEGWPEGRKVEDFDLRRFVGDATPAQIPRSPAGELLQRWIQAHNQASAEALRHWLRTSLNPSVSDQDVDKRLGWYVEATSMFGPLSQQPLAVVEDEPHRLLVHLVRSDLDARQRMDPLNIVVVELDVDATDPRYLARGLGLGSLACEARKSDEEAKERKR